VEALYIEGLAQYKLRNYADSIAAFKKAGDILQEWADLNSALHRLQMHPEQVRERKLTEERMAQDYNWAQNFAQDMGMWPGLNKALGDAYLANHDFMMARNSYRRAADLNELGDKTDADVFVRVARADLADAIAQFTEDNQLFTAIALLREADQTLDEALQLNAKSAEAYEVRGEIYTFQAETYDAIPKFGITTHSFTDAESAFTKALQTAPDMADAMAGLARVNLRQAEMKPGLQKSKDQLNKGLALVQQALTLRPDSAKYYTLLGEIYLAQEKYAEARGAAEKAETLDSKFAEAYNTSGLANYFTGNLSQALRDFQQAIDLSPHEPHYHFNLGNTYFQLQSWYMARREYTQALSYTPTATLAKTTAQRSYILYMTALTHHETRAYDAEISTLNQALAVDISYFDAYLQLARAYAAKGEYRGAQRALDAAQSRAANKQESSQVETLSGQIYEVAGDVHAAVAAYSTALNLDKNNVVAREALNRLSGQG
jgi:tetratricopeptide (TPR) repeat protein